MKIFLVLIALALSYSEASNELYKNFKVYSVEIKNQESLKLLKHLDDNADMYGLDFWSLHRVIGSTADVMVKPTTQKHIENYFTANHLDFSVKINDLKEYYDQNDNFKPQGKVMSGSFDLSRYYTYPEIEEYIYRLARNYPELVDIEVIGQSYENRNIYTLNICRGPNKPTVFIDAGIHAREWIAPVAALHLISQLVEVRNLTNLCEKLNFVIVPSINPDGYSYSLRVDRNWRKSRRPSGNGCVGTDQNRNFAHRWGGPGASDNPCSDTFRGTSAGSEYETQVLTRALDRYANETEFYLTIHSYGRYLLYPWGHDLLVPENWRDIDRIAAAGAAAANRHNGARYLVGGSAQTLYVTTGSSQDHALGAIGIPISITLECPGSTFTPPATQIHELAVEISVT